VSVVDLMILWQGCRVWSAPGICARCYESLMGLWFCGLEGRCV
jgi:hypothetical protein